MSFKGDEIDLETAVRALRDQLLRAAAQAGDQQILFEVGPIEMEFLVELRRDAKLRGGVRAFVASAEGEAAAGRTRTHRVCLTLTAKDPTGGNLHISSADDADASGLTAVRRR
ncbi:MULTISPECIES: trypco2 family protein [Streptomyces]|uniref:Trypsin-co-occurring domain-containing protein n=1 Tax=Streptomyces lycii TaxID=2654337 RepID=A0ABQ7FE85_9ACTN|nr:MULTISPECIES: trypco2 family protein [Streptomyces]KAF4405532.1 hypothetical protein GCU69_29875 [Streptomyces lycii]PGH47083.1 hypothetical protein CRI70_30490 [Streptomyces sp. Ru87]